MDKLLIDQYGNAILYKVDTNSIKIYLITLNVELYIQHSRMVK